MEKITREDLLKLQFTGGPAISPDGKHTVWNVYKQNLKENNYESRLFLLDNETGKKLQLTDLGKESPAIWTDDETLLFTTERSKLDEPEENEEKTCFYRLNIHGGEAMKAFEIDKNVLDIQLLSGSQYLLTVLENLRKDQRKTGKDDLKEGTDYYVLEEIPFYSNGRGYISRLRRTLYLYDSESGCCKKIPSDYFDVESVDANDRYVVYTGKEYEEKAEEKNLARLYDLQTGKTTELVEPGTMSINNAMLVENGVILAMNDQKTWGSFQYDDLYRYEMTTGETKLLCTMDITMKPWIGSDSRRGGGKSCIVSGDQMYFIGQETYRTPIYSVHVRTGELKKEVPFNGFITSFDRVNGTLVLCGQEANDLADLYIVKDGQAVRMTNVNEALLKDKYVAQAKYIPFTDSDGVQIDGWVMEPIDFDPEKTYPGILHVHGGPRGTYGELFNHQMQMLCSEGYFVFFSNPRGGEGYGQAFADLRGKYGTIDFQDLMEFTDHVLKLYPQLDPKRLGETGGSYGGFMSNWIEGHTDRFGAIVSCCSISNWIADFVACEFGYTFDKNEIGATPWDDLDKMWIQSPLKYANQAKTPILFLHSLQDYNCPIDQGREMFIAMKYFGVPSKMVVIEGENHALSSSGRPKQRQLRLTELQAWFDKYLKA